MQWCTAAHINPETRRPCPCLLHTCLQAAHGAHPSDPCAPAVAGAPHCQRCPVRWHLWRPCGLPPAGAADGRALGQQRRGRGWQRPAGSSRVCNRSSSGRARRVSRCCSGSSRPRRGQQEAAAGGRSGLSCGSRRGGATSGGSSCTGPGSTSTSGGGNSGTPSSSRRAGCGCRCVCSECSVPLGASVPPAAGAVRRAVHTLPLLRTQVSNQAIMGVCVRWMSLSPAWLGSACLRLLPCALVLTAVLLCPPLSLCLQGLPARPAAPVAARPQLQLRGRQLELCSRAAPVGTCRLGAAACPVKVPSRRRGAGTPCRQQRQGRMPCVLVSQT